ncbi:MAG: molybdenum cofactor guanylyltransferase [Rhodobacteraceae bacterium]|nr:molybdenum cofactor guanylyltransferase [Paracoccaceae bacterium]
MAGGEGRRMGGADKALLRLAGVSLVERACAALAPQVSGIAVSYNGDPAALPQLGHPVIADPFPGGRREGPLAGILAGLDLAERRGAAWLASVPVDAPLLPGGWVAALAALGRGGVPVMARSRDGRVHPVVALWPLSCRAGLAERFAAGERSIRAAAGSLGAVVATLEAGEDAFLNVNTPADLARAEEILRSRG